MATKQFAIEAARMLADTRCHNVVVLDVTGISPITDYLVIATGTSARQMKSACDAVEEMGRPLGHRGISRSDDDTSNWMLMDFFNIVVHVFGTESRLYYDLDNLWGDARRIPWERER